MPIGGMFIWGTATLAAPRVDAFLESNNADGQRSYRVKPPEAKQRVTQKSDKQGRRQIGAEHVLLTLTMSGGFHQQHPSWGSFIEQAPTVSPAWSSTASTAPSKSATPSISQ